MYQIPQKNKKITLTHSKRNLKTYMNHFNNPKSKVKTVIYSKIKKTYRYQKYLNFFVNNQLRKNVTQLRMLSHCPPIKY